MRSIRIGMMGLGQVGRQIYMLALQDARFEVVAISDIGQPEILCHLLNKALGKNGVVQLEDNYLVSESCRTRLMSSVRPTEIPWDVFDTDFVIDTTGRYRSLAELSPHLANGAKRVVISTLPEDEIDRVILCGVNDDQAHIDDRIISAGSASTTAAALALKVISESYQIEHASMTSVHAYTSDQSLQDYAGADYRRSRSGAENIIPNATPALQWIQKLLPSLNGRMTAYALNVPVQMGSMLDLTVVLTEPFEGVSAVTELFVEAARANPAMIGTVNDPIVSSDVKGDSHSLLVDLQGSMQAGSRMLKLLGWHETLGHAHRILDVVASYDRLDIPDIQEVA